MPENQQQTEETKEPAPVVVQVYQTPPPPAAPQNSSPMPEWLKGEATFILIVIFAILLLLGILSIFPRQESIDPYQSTPTYRAPVEPRLTDPGTSNLDADSTNPQPPFGDY